MKFISTLLFSLSLFSINLLYGQTIWTDIEESEFAPNRTLERAFELNEYRTLSLELPNLRSILRDAPMEFSGDTPVEIEFPMPNGQMEKFAIVESPIMEPVLAEQNPSIKTFAGKSINDPATSIRLDYNSQNFHGVIHQGRQTILIEPYASDLQEYYVSYFLSSAESNGEITEQYECGVHSPNWDGLAGDQLEHGDEVLSLYENSSRSVEAVDLYTYRFAVATTVEYSNDALQSFPSVLASVTSVTNQINSVFERDVAIRLMLIDGVESLFYTGNANEDPFTNGNTGNMILENQVNMDAEIGLDAYDIGHVFGTNAGGLASTFSVCTNNKARGASCRFSVYSGSLFYIVAGHEVGHQFSAFHNFNMCDMENESPPTAYEPGSGSSIMCYNGNGVCGSNHLQDVTDDYFHINAMNRIFSFSRDPDSGGGCAQVVSTGNNTPVAEIPIDGGFFIPISTPFELTGVGTDEDGDDLTYSWEQYNLGPPSPLGSPIGAAPIFRSFPPSDSPTRVFPRIQTIVNNANDPHEVLPTYARVLTFRFTARDNNEEAGSYDWDEFEFEATGSAGPFLVMTPNNGDETWEVGDYVEVSWDVANTTNSIVNCQNVNIKLSTDGGFTYPITLIENVPNDGSEFITVPDAVSTSARVRVEAADNVFFDISNNDFEIVPPAAPGFSLIASPSDYQACLPDPVKVSLSTATLLDFDGTVSFNVASGLPPGANASFDPVSVAPGETSTMTIDLSNTTEEGIFTVEVEATADGADTEIRPVVLDLVYNDFSDLEILSPSGSNIAVLPDFSWNGLPHADTYELEISTSPLFDNIVYSESGIEGTSVTSGLTLDGGIQYFWRIRPVNECGAGAYTNVLGFQTIALTCNEVVNADPVIIPSQGTPTVSSVVNVNTSGVLSDLNLKNIKGNHNGFGDIKFSLENPQGVVKELVSGVICFSAANFDFGIDDDSPNTDFACPPVGGVSYQPTGDDKLADFNGEDGLGEWTLLVEVTDDFGDGGVIEGWTMEFCGSFAASDPFVELNDGMCVLRGEDKAVSENFLIISDMDNSAGELTYTLVVVPQNGDLTLNDTPLTVGDSFTHEDIQNLNVRYANTNTDADADNFAFIVTDGDGGFLGTPSFDIEITDDSEACLTNLENLNPGKDIILYPNPAKDLVFIEFKQLLPGKTILEIVDVQGRVVQTQSLEQALGTIKLDTSLLSSGVYFVTLQTENSVITKKVMIE